MTRRARNSPATLAAALGCVTLLFALAYVAGSEQSPRSRTARATLSAGEGAPCADEALKSTTACHAPQTLQLRFDGSNGHAPRIDSRLDGLAAHVAQLTRERAQRFSDVVTSGSPLRSWLVLPLRAQGPPAQS